MKGQRVSATFDSDDAAHEWAARTEKRIVKGETVRKFDDTENPTVAYILEKYAREVCPKRRSVDFEQGRLLYLNKTYPKVFQRRASDFGMEQMDDFIEQHQKRKNRFGRPNATSTVVRDIALLGAVFKHALKKWKAPFPNHVNPTKDTDRPKLPPHRVRRVKPQETKALLAHMGYEEGMQPVTNGQWVAWSFLFCLETAMRKGELLKATWGELKVGERFLHLPKTKNGSHRDVPLNRRARELLSWLKTGEDGAPIVPVNLKTFNGQVWRAKRALGIADLHFHDSRHEATTQLARKVPTILHLQAITGHKNLSQLQIYFNPTATEIADLLD
jgi:integrase